MFLPCKKIVGGKNLVKLLFGYYFSAMLNNSRVKRNKRNSRQAAKAQRYSWRHGVLA
jgi:hypothetical protein